MKKLLPVCVIVIVCLIGNIIISKLGKYLDKKKKGIHVSFICSIIKVAWTVAAIVILSELFQPTKAISNTLLTSSSLLVAVVGFAAQQVLADIMSGLILSWSKPFDVGEKITIESLGISGIVEKMDLRHTVVKTYHNSRLLVPNSVINKSVIENANFENHYIGNYLEIPISYDSNIDQAIKIVENIVSSHPLVIDVREDKTVGKKVKVFVKDLSENGVVLKCTVRTRNLDDSFEACSDIRRHIKNQFDIVGIKIHCQRIKVIDTKEKGEEL